MLKINNNIKLIVYDFDGVMTDNKVYFDQDGNEMIQVNRADGLGVAEIKKLGIKQIIISTEKNSVVTARANKLGIYCLQGIEIKKKALIDYCYKNDYKLQNVAYVGNDLNDKDVMKIAGVTFCPDDAHKSVKTISHHVLKTKGGQGVARELLEIIDNQRVE